MFCYNYLLKVLSLSTHIADYSIMAEYNSAVFTLTNVETPDPFIVSALGRFFLVREILPSLCCVEVSNID